MAEHPDRSYSFRQHDEQSFNNPQQGYQAYQPQTQQYQSYRPGGEGISPIESPPHQYQAANSPPPPPQHSQRMHPGMHPGSSFNEMQAQRNYGPMPSQAAAGVPRRPVGPPSAAPPREYAGAYEMGPQQRRESFTTPGADNLSERAPGAGISGIAMGVAGAHERESGVQALRDIENWGRSGHGGVAGATNERDPFEYGSQHGAYDPYIPDRNYQAPLHSQASSSSFEPLARSGSGPGTATPGAERNMYYDGRPRSTHFGPAHAYPYMDDPYSNRFSASNTRLDPSLAPIDPNIIEDDGDDGITPAHGQKRRSFLGIGASRPPSRGSSHGIGAPTGAAAVAGAAGAAGALSAFGRRDASGFYGPVPGNAMESNMASENVPEKSEWLTKQSSGKKKLKWIVGSIIVLLVIGGVVAGVLLGVVFKKGGSSSGSGSSSEADSSDDSSGDLNKNSAAIKNLLNNKNLHKVFPGMDYTPMNAQYPECLTLPPSQNNVTRDMAVLSQLTNAVRLYGTDCNQTEMVLHSIKQLGLTDMKVWLGVYLDNNQTTNTRQLSQMWDILDKYGDDPFKGAIIGNEVLFRKDMTATALAEVLTEAKTNMTNKKYNLPIATSDLGDNWTAQLAESVDIVMSNIHPFFAGVTASAAAGWTWDFWQDHDVVVTQGLTGKTHVISETGWPSAGGNDCGESTCTSSSDGSVAGITEMNTFMNNWVCQALSNGTQYFWFEAIDEPWKVIFNTPTEQWEDKWGLMDANRQLKKGVQIPSCNGQTVS